MPHFAIGDAILVRTPRRLRNLLLIIPFVGLCPQRARAWRHHLYHNSISNCIKWHFWGIHIVLIFSCLQKPLRQSWLLKNKVRQTTTTVLPSKVADLLALCWNGHNPFECTRRYISREIRAFRVAELLKSYENHSLWNTATVLVS